MSLDYPFYEQLVRRRHRAARWWRIGDRLYYPGLLSALFGLMFAPAYSVFWPDGGRTPVVASVVAIGLGVGVLLAGAWLKGRAYTLAARDGIHPE